MTFHGIRRSVVSAVVLAGVAAVLCWQAGCIRRTMTISTSPQGATVRLNHEDVGQTPVTVDFTWYGDYDLVFEKAGYETLQTHHKLNAPWYQVPPIDLFAEVFVPYTIHDHHEVSFDLAPASQPAVQDLTARAKEFRDKALYENK